MSKPVKFGGQARPYALIVYLLGVGLPVLLTIIVDGGVYGDAIIIGGIAAGVVAVAIGPRRLELDDGRARVLRGFVRMNHVLAEAPIGELELGGAGQGSGALRGYRVALMNESMWLTERASRRLRDALRGQRMIG